MSKAKETFAIFGCHEKGILWMPFRLRIGIKAVNMKEAKVKIPEYIKTGLPKI